MKKNDDYRKLLSEINRIGKIFSPVDKKHIMLTAKKVGFMPDDLINLYLHSNGIQCKNLKIFPIYTENQKKLTWDSIEHANNYKTAKTPFPSDDFLDNFIVFAEIGGLNRAFYAKNDSKIWYEDDEAIHETDLDLWQLIENAMR